MATEPRQPLQQNDNLRVIKTSVALQCLEMLTELAEIKRDAYVKLYGQFDDRFKRGILEDPANRPKVAELLRL